MKISESAQTTSTSTDVYESKSHELRSLISVTEPYFALSNIKVSDNEITANFPLENQDHMEYKCMSIAEVGRHMAILGSLAMAKANPRKQKHYYLATDAFVYRMDSTINSNDGLFLGKVKLKSIDKRTGAITGELFTPQNELHYKIEVHYSILHHTIFERMFSSGKQITSNDGTINPYNKNAPLYSENIGLKGATASLGIIRKESCLGHFDNYPALPIARLGASLVNLSGRQYNFIRNNDDKYYVTRAEIHARTFVFAGSKLDMFSQLIKSENTDEVCIESQANTVDCCRAADLKLWFR